MVAISTTRAEFDVQLQEYQAHGAQKPEKPKGSGVKGKMSKQETVMYRKLLKGIEDEKQLAAKVEELVPLIEKEEAVSLSQCIRSVTILILCVADTTSEKEDRGGQ